MHVWYPTQRPTHVDMCWCFVLSFPMCSGVGPAVVKRPSHPGLSVGCGSWEATGQATVVGFLRLPRRVHMGRIATSVSKRLRGPPTNSTHLHIWRWSFPRLR